MTGLKWKEGDLCYVELFGKKHPAKVLKTAFSAEGNYLQTMIEYYVSYPDWDGKTITKAFIYPKPVQSYKLRKRVV